MECNYSSSESEGESKGEELSAGFEMCCARRGSGGALAFDPAALEEVILAISDKFDFRVVLGEERARAALLVTTGLSLAGSIVGHHYGGRLGAALGGAVGGACGLGIVVVSMRDIWEDIKSKVSEVFELVYDYLAGLGLADYRAAAALLTAHGADSEQVALLLLQAVSGVLGKKVLSSLVA